MEEIYTWKQSKEEYFSEDFVSYNVFSYVVELKYFFCGGTFLVLFRQPRYLPRTGLAWQNLSLCGREKIARKFFSNKLRESWAATFYIHKGLSGLRTPHPKIGTYPAS